MKRKQKFSLNSSAAEAELLQQMRKACRWKPRCSIDCYGSVTLWTVLKGGYTAQLCTVLWGGNPRRAHNKLWTPLTRPSRSTRRVLTDGGINTQMCIGNQTLPLIMTYTSHPWNFCQISTHSWFLPHRARCGSEMPTNWFQKQRLQKYGLRIHKSYSDTDPDPCCSAFRQPIP